MNQFDYRNPLAWSQLPDPTELEGQTVTCGDIGTSKYGVELAASDGEWKPVNGSCVLFNSAGIFPEGDTSTALQQAADVTIHAGIMGTQGKLRISVVAESAATENVKTLHVRLGNTDVLSQNFPTSGYISAQIEVQNFNLVDTQKVSCVSNAGSTLATTNEDTSVELSLYVLTQLSSDASVAEEQVFVQCLTVELVK